MTDNIFGAITYYDDYSDYFTPAQEKFYKKHMDLDFDDLPEKKQIRYETLQTKLMEKVSKDVSKSVKKGVKKFGEKFKNKKALPGDFEKELNKFFVESDYYF